MAAPRGKGIYARDPRFYPDLDPCRYAADLGCQFVALHDASSPDELFLRGKDLGLDVYVWQGPDAWLPATWQETLYSHAERIDQLRLSGMICDVEHAPAWKHDDTALSDLLTGLASAAYTYPSVGFTSFPDWPWVPDVAAAAGAYGLWGSPQLYGILEPASGPELVARGDAWKALFETVTPSLAAYRRTPEEQAAYLDWFLGERGGIFWQSVTQSGHILPRVGTPGWEVLHDWNVRGAGATSRPLLAVATERIVRPARLRRS